MSASPVPEQYLEIERAAEFKSEYYDGRMHARSGTSLPHAFITSNLALKLVQHGVDIAEFP